ncbi:uncharacterized protein LOC144102303 [Amblyomma americanum]
MYSSPLAASFRLVHEEPELEYRAAACLRRLCLKRYHHVGASDSRDPLHLSHSRDGEGERLLQSQGLLRPVALGKLTEQMKPASTSEKLSSPRRPLRHRTLSRQKDVGGGLFPSLGVLLESQCWAQSPNAASFYCLHSFRHVGGFDLDTASPAFPSHTKIWTRPRLPVLVEPHVPALCSAVLDDGGINKVPASVSHQAHVLLAISSVIQVGARRARTRVSSSGLLTSAVSETLSSRGRQRQPRPTSSLPQQGWGKREAVTEPGPAAPGSTGQAHQLFSPRRPLRHGPLSRQKNVGGGLFPSLGVLLESQCWAQSPNPASFYCLHSFRHVGGFDLDTASPAFPSHTKIWTRLRLPGLVEPHVPALCSVALKGGGINEVPASVSHQAHVLLAISSVIQVGARRARTRVSSSGLLTSAVSETLSSRGRQRQPRPTSSQPQQGWGRREAVAGRLCPDRQFRDRSRNIGRSDWARCYPGKPKSGSITWLICLFQPPRRPFFIWTGSVKRPYETSMSTSPVVTSKTPALQNVCRNRFGVSYKAARFCSIGTSYQGFAAAAFTCHVFGP